jgi:large subunit ribosomal protein L17
MRHAQRGRKLGRTTAHRLAMFRNQLASLVVHERIVTTLPKAKELRPIAEKLITRGKGGSLADRRQVSRVLSDRGHVKKLFDDIGPRFADRAGGYLRIVKLGPRIGDGAETAALQFVDYDPVRDEPAPEKEKKGRTKGDDQPAKTDRKAKPEKKAKAEKKEKAPRPEKKAKAPKAATKSKTVTKGKTDKRGQKEK